MTKDNYSSQSGNAPAELYFRDVAHDVFDQYLEEHGAVHVSNDRVDIVRYDAVQWFAEVLYLPSDGPKYCPRVEVGVISELFTDPRRNRIDVLHTVPIDSELRRYNFIWSYINEQQARVAFARVRDEIMAMHTAPFLNDVSGLRGLLEIRCHDLDQQWDDEIRRHNEGIARSAADAAFRAEDYESVIRHLTSISADSLSLPDRKKLHIARNHVK